MKPPDINMGIAVSRGQRPQRKDIPMIPPLGTPRRILMTADTIGGIWTYALALSRMLGNHGINVLLATMGKPLSPDQRKNVARLKNVEVAASEFKLEWMDDCWRDVDRAGVWLLELEREFNPDVVHLNGFAHGAIGWKSPVLMVAHSCVVSWWSEVKQTRLPSKWRKYRTTVAGGLRAADLVVAPTRTMAKYLGAFHGLHDARVIPNGIAPRDFAIAKKEEFILSAGRLWDEAKNIEALAEIAPEIPWPIVVAGETQRPDGSRRNLENVLFAGRLTPGQIADFDARASIYALPARYEPFGLSVLEAAAAGCALVLGDIPSLRELWNGAAFFAPPDDRQCLKKRLLHLIHNPISRRHLAANARKRAGELTDRRMTDSYLAAYAEIAVFRNLDACNLEESRA